MKVLVMVEVVGEMEELTQAEMLLVVVEALEDIQVQVELDRQEVVQVVPVQEAVLEAAEGLKIVLLVMEVVLDYWVKVLLETEDRG